MKRMRSKLFFITALFLGGLFAGNVLAAGDSTKEGGIGGTGAPAMRGGIGGTGSPAAEGGIGGTGLRPSDESAMPALAGKVLYVVGQVEALSSGQFRSLSKGDAVRVGDTLKSSKGASLQLRMEDGGTIALRPESQLAIESFVYKGVQDGSERIELALMGGGFRAVTGNIGKLHKENYRIHTPNASIGILGTDHEIVFVPAIQAGQATLVEPGTYNHVISGATTLQSERGNLLIQPNQTGFASLDGGSLFILNAPLPIFDEPNAHAEERESSHDDRSNSEHGSDGNPSLPDSVSRKEHDKLTHADHVSTDNVDIKTLERDASPAAAGSAVVGANMTNEGLSVGSAQAGMPGESLFVEHNEPGSYSNNTTGFNFFAREENEPIDLAGAQVDGIDVSWGIYADGYTFDKSGNAVKIDFHPFAYANEGATPQALVGTLSGNATFSNVVGYTEPVTESGDIGGSINLNIGVNLGTSTLTRYNLSVADDNARNWTGTLNGPVPLAAFALNGTPLAVSCSGASCGSGQGSGLAAGVLIGPNAGGLISSYVLSTTSGQSVAGAAIVSRP